jgi:hypothetical protein
MRSDPPSGGLSDAPRLLSWTEDPASALARLEAQVSRAARAAGERRGCAAPSRWRSDPAQGEALFWPDRALSRVSHAGAGPALRILTFAGRQLSVVSGDAEGGDADAPDAHCAAILRGLALLQSVAEPALTFTLAMTRRVTITPHTQRARFWSSTPERHLYGTRLWNLDAETSAARIADALLHEAIHTWLDLDALTRGRGVRPGGPWGPEDVLSDGVSRLVSPWTGAPLSISIFAHACFVWYGLLNLWSTACLGPSPPREAPALAKAAWKGFLMRPDLRLAELSSGLADDVVGTIAQMTAVVIEASELEPSA